MQFALKIDELYVQIYKKVALKLCISCIKIVGEIMKVKI